MSRLSPAAKGVLLAWALTLPAASSTLAQTAPPPAAPEKGDVVPAFETLAVDGKPSKLDFPKGSQTVLLFFLSSCPVCHKMIPEWNSAYERRPKNLKVVGVIMDQEPPGFFGTISIAFPVVRSPGNQFLRSLNVNRAPVTLRVGDGGRIEDVALGIVDPIRLGELFKP
jgi:thiol-disulfide isomerase/thioredoxin